MNKPLPELNGLTILVIDDDPAILSGLNRALSGLGAEVLCANSLSSARAMLDHEPLHAVLADLKLKDGIGLELLKPYRTSHPDGAFYLITGHGSIDSAVGALQQGVRDYLQKPLDPFQLARRLQEDLLSQLLGSSLAERLRPYLLFCDTAMEQALSDLPEMASNEHNVLINGETGTGKELIARAVHGLSHRAEGPFIAVNCGAIPEALLEDELFGHEKGAFTGALRQRCGRFEQAQGGSLFLDEIGEMPPHFQVRLLRALEDRTIQRVGSEQSIPLDVRVIAATHRDLQKAVKEGLFREDLYYRLAILPIHLPPLRERRDDIPLLATHFLQRALQDLGQNYSPPQFDAETRALLTEYHWPGNVRELRNLMTRLALRLPQGTRQISIEWLESLLPGLSLSAQGQVAFSNEEGVFIPADSTLQQAERLLIDAALLRTSNNRTRAAQQLGIGERTLRRKLNRA